MKAALVALAACSSPLTPPPPPPRPPPTAMPIDAAPPLTARTTCYLGMSGPNFGTYEAIACPALPACAPGIAPGNALVESPNPDHRRVRMVDRGDRRHTQAALPTDPTVFPDDLEKVLGPGFAEPRLPDLERCLHDAVVAWATGPARTDLNVSDFVVVVRVGRD